MVEASAGPRPTGRTSGWGFALLTAAFVLAASSCTDAELEEIPAPETRRADELGISGDLCTRSPEELKFPMRVLFVVDTSVSMRVTDPEDPQTGKTRREAAVRQAWQRLLARNPDDIKVGIMRFSADAESKTPVNTDSDPTFESFFTSDKMLLDGATTELSQARGNSSFVIALDEAYFEIRRELENATQESLPRTSYSVIFLSDGIPQTSGGQDRGGSREQIIGAVKNLRDLAESRDVGDFAFHTAFLATGDAQHDEDAKTLLEDMAEAGGGNFRSFPSGEELNFLFANLTSLRRAFTLKMLSAVNISAVMDRNQVPEPRPVTTDAGAMMTPAAGDASAGDAAFAEPVLERPTPNPMTWVDLNGSSSIECGEPMVDTDGDGLADLTEFRIGSDPLSRDTDEDGLGDLLEWKRRDSGLEVKKPNKSDCYTPERCKSPDGNDSGQCDCVRDQNDDGTCDCAMNKRLQCVDGTKRDCVDEDGDGWCDCPDPDDDGTCDYADSDGDGLHDCEELFYATKPRGVDSDADGVPDPTELRFDTNPSTRDGRDNLDADQTNNEIELLANTDPRCDDAKFRSRVAYQYDVSSRGMKGSKTCYDFGLDNLTLVPTLENKQSKYPGNGWNRILLYAGEVAFDDPSSFAAYRIACVMARYNPKGNRKEPPSGHVQLSEDDFVEVRDFEPQKHCIWP